MTDRFSQPSESFKFTSKRPGVICEPNNCFYPSCICDHKPGGPNPKPRYRILWSTSTHDIIEFLNPQLKLSKWTHIIAPVFNGGLDCVNDWYYFNNETLVKIK